MEQLPNGYTLVLADGCFPLSTDSMLLAHFAKLPRNASVLDLGSGCGTLGLLLCAKDAACTVIGLELSENAHNAALENINRNQLASRLKSICADLRSLPVEYNGMFHCCISNPPYFSGGPASSATPVARRDDCCTPEALFRTAAKALRYGGDFFLVHKPEKLAQLISCGAAVSLEAKNLTLVRHKEGGSIILILLQFRKGGKSGLQIHEHCLFDAHGKPTAYYQDVYHIK
ncbi:MAG: methyltransferase [Oscillospiraceae bacterium]|nr:methyltransferase [Oscillospiraceae bacterium]